VHSVATTGLQQAGLLGDQPVVGPSRCSGDKPGNRASAPLHSRHSMHAGTECNGHPHSAHAWHACMGAAPAHRGQPWPSSAASAAAPHTLLWLLRLPLSAARLGTPPWRSRPLSARLTTRPLPAASSVKRCGGTCSACSVKQCVTPAALVQRSDVVALAALALPPLPLLHWRGDYGTTVPLHFNRFFADAM
jgi:hypothetical protein